MVVHAHADVEEDVVEQEVFLPGPRGHLAVAFRVAGGGPGAPGGRWHVSCLCGRTCCSSDRGAGYMSFDDARRGQSLHARRAAS
jgi:hypothetical protein